MTEKKSPNLAAAVEKDLTSDLKKVGGFFRGLVGFTQRAEKAIRAAGEDPNHPRPEAPRSTVVVEASPCDVCGGTRVVGGVKKIACPACK